MNPAPLPTTDAAEQTGVKICMRLTRSQLGNLDRFCAGNELPRSQVIRRALKHHLIQRAIGREASGSLPAFARAASRLSVWAAPPSAVAELEVVRRR